LDFNKGAIGPTNDSVYSVVVDQWEIHVDTFFEHQASDPVFNTLVEPG
jgi:hypothetical protein